MKKAILSRLLVFRGLFFLCLLAAIGCVFALIAPLATARLFTEVFSRAFKD